MRRSSAAMRRRASPSPRRRRCRGGGPQGLDQREAPAARIARPGADRSAAPRLRGRPGAAGTRRAGARALAGEQAGEETGRQARGGGGEDAVLRAVAAGGPASSPSGGGPAVSASSSDSSSSSLATPSRAGARTRAAAAARSGSSTAARPSRAACRRARAGRGAARAARRCRGGPRRRTASRPSRAARRAGGAGGGEVRQRKVRDRSRRDGVEVEVEPRRGRRGRRAGSRRPSPSSRRISRSAPMPGRDAVAGDLDGAGVEHTGDPRRGAGCQPLGHRHHTTPPWLAGEQARLRHRPPGRRVAGRSSPPRSASSAMPAAGASPASPRGEARATDRATPRAPGRPGAQHDAGPAGSSAARSAARQASVPGCVGCGPVAGLTRGPRQRPGDARLRPGLVEGLRRRRCRARSGRRRGAGRG